MILAAHEAPPLWGWAAGSAKMASNPAEKENLDLADLALAREDGAKRLKARPLPAPDPHLLLPWQPCRAARTPRLRDATLGRP